MSADSELHGSLCAEFTRVWEERQLYLLVEGMRHQLMRQGISPNDVRSAFEQMDVDGDGRIDGTEFSSFVTKTLRVDLTHYLEAKNMRG